MKTIVLFFTAILLAGCGAYKQNIMFKPGENFVPEPIKAGASKAEHNYVVQKNDYLTLKVFSNNGEKLIEPNPELTEQGQANKSEAKELQYLVDLNGVVKFPMIGEIKVEGLSLRQAEQTCRVIWNTLKETDDALDVGLFVQKARGAGRFH